jgi:hypothetical protein
MLYRIAGLARFYSRVESWKCRGVYYNGRSEKKVVKAFIGEAF